MIISEFNFKKIHEYKGYTLGLELMEDSDGFDKQCYSIFKYHKDDIHESNGQQYTLASYLHVEYLSGFTYTSKGVIESFKERVDGISTSG